MRDLIIGKDIAYALSTAGGTIAGSWAADLLTDGGIAIVDNDGALIAHNAASITAPYVHILTKTGTTSKTSFPLVKGLTKYSKLAYAAPAAPIKFIGSDVNESAGDYSFNLPATLTVGSVVGFGIINKSLPQEDTRRHKEYSYTVVSGDVMTGSGSNNIFTKLIAIVNADPNGIVTAAAHLHDVAGNIDGIKLTSNTAGVDFGIYRISGVLQDADIVEYELVNGSYDASATNGTAYSAGVGTVAHIQELLKATASRDGNNQYMMFSDLLYSGGSQIVAGTTYTTYVFTTEVVNTDSISQSNKPPMELVIAVPSGSAAVIAAIDNLGAKIV